MAYNEESLKKYKEYWVPRCRDDFELFCDKLLGIKLRKGQKRLEKERHDSELETGKWKTVYMILAGNRFGKSVYEGCKHIWKNYYKLTNPEVPISPEMWPHFKYQTFNLAPASELTKIILQTILKILRSELTLKKPDGTFCLNECKIRDFIDTPGLNNYDTNHIPDQGPFRVRFSNDSLFRAFTLGATHGDGVQGVGFMYGSYDEFGRSKNPDKEIDDLLPRLFDYKGELDIITTPDIENELSCAYILDKTDLTRMGELDWFLFEGDIRENEDTDEADLIKRTQGMSDAKRNQILSGKISMSGACYFEAANVIKMFNGTATYSMYGIPGRFYSIGLDTAGGGKDYWAINVLDITDPDHWHRVFYYYDKLNQPGFNIGFTKTILDRFFMAGAENVSFTMDKTNEAGSIYYNEFANYNVRGFRFGMEKGTGKSTKADLLDVARRAINEKDLIKCTDDRMLRNQIISYKGPMDDKKQTTDALMSFALAVYYPYKQRLDGSNEICIDL
jgi:hypothetical protein